ncbi:MJ0042-type zinc finger domain-containing protein, partial [Achromobacter xylosoxidans]
MALTTRCPECGTSFKVVPDQLRVRNGLVRCGACATVFDGRACLLPETGAGMPAAAIPASNTPIAAPAPAASQAIAAPVLV